MPDGKDKALADLLLFYAFEVLNLFLVLVHSFIAAISDTFADGVDVLGGRGKAQIEPGAELLPHYRMVRALEAKQHKHGLLFRQRVLGGFGIVIIGAQKLCPPFVEIHACQIGLDSFFGLLVC